MASRARAVAAVSAASAALAALVAWRWKGTERTQKEMEQRVQGPFQGSLARAYTSLPRVYRQLLRSTTVHVLRSVEDCERALSLAADELVLGFDAEWKPHGEQKVAVVQLSTAQHAFVIQLFHMPSVPPTLKRLLEDPTVLKVGVGCTQDASKLRLQYSIKVAGCVELNELVGRCRLDPEEVFSTGIGLKSLCQSLLSVELIKHYTVQCGNWEVPTLSLEQVLYAASDAHYGRECFVALYQARKAHSTPTTTSTTVSANGAAAVGGWRRETIRHWCSGLVDHKLRKKRNQEAAQKQKQKRKKNDADALTDGTDQEHKGSPEGMYTESKGDSPPPASVRRRKTAKASTAQGVVAQIQHDTRRLTLLCEAEQRIVKPPYSVLNQVLPVRVWGSSHVRRRDTTSLQGTPHHWSCLPVCAADGQWKTAWCTNKEAVHSLEYKFPIPVSVTAYSVRAPPQHSCIARMPQAWVLQGGVERDDGSVAWINLHSTSQMSWKYHAGFLDDEVPGVVQYFQLPLVGNSTASSTDAPHGWVWEWESGKAGVWRAFDKAVQDVVERVFSLRAAAETSGEETEHPPVFHVGVPIGTKNRRIRDFEMDLSSMTQHRVRLDKPSIVRRIRRRPARQSEAAGSAASGNALSFRRFRWLFCRPSTSANAKLKNARRRNKAKTEDDPSAEPTALDTKTRTSETKVTPSEAKSTPSGTQAVDLDDLETLLLDGPPFALALAQVDLFGVCSAQEVKAEASRCLQAALVGDYDLPLQTHEWASITSSSIYDARATAGPEHVERPERAFRAEWVHMNWHSRLDTQHWLRYRHIEPLVITGYSFRAICNGHAKSHSPHTWKLLDQTGRTVHCIEDETGWDYSAERNSQPGELRSYTLNSPVSITELKWEFSRGQPQYSDKGNKEFYLAIACVNLAGHPVSQEAAVRTCLRDCGLNDRIVPILLQYLYDAPCDALTQ